MIKADFHGTHPPSRLKRFSDLKRFLSSYSLCAPPPPLTHQLTLSVSRSNITLPFFHSFLLFHSGKMLGTFFNHIHPFPEAPIVEVSTLNLFNSQVIYSQGKLEKNCNSSLIVYFHVVKLISYIY